MRHSGCPCLTVLYCEDYGIVWNQPMAGGGVMVGKDVRLTVDIEADREN